MQSEDTHSEAKVNLARRAVACKRWRWMPGMLTIDGDRMSDRDIDVDVRIGLYDGALPDLDDPATLGCLLALVREAWGDVRIVCEWHARERGSIVTGAVTSGTRGAMLPFTGGHEAEALVAALEAAP